jgi:tetratricopeptide (TPR) repeat protein
MRHFKPAVPCPGGSGVGPNGAVYNGSVHLDRFWGLVTVERKSNLMIRSAKALLLVSALGCLSFAQTPNQTTGRNTNAPEDKKSAVYYHFAMGRLYSELAGAYAGSQNEYITKAIQHYQEALKADPTASMVFEELTDLYAQTGRFQDAIAEGEQLLKNNPDNLDARRMLARIYARAITAGSPEGRYNEAMLAKAIEQYQAVTTKDPKDAESWIMLGRLYHIKGNNAEQEKAYTAALKADPNNEDALAGLAVMYSDMGDSQKAIEKLKEATAKKPNEQTLAALAEAYERTRDYKNAADTLRRALELYPDNDRFERSLAENLLFSNQLDDALKLYQQLASEDEKDTGLKVRIAEIYRVKHDLVKAREALNKAKAADSGSMDVAYEEVNLLEAEGKSDQAILQSKKLVDDTSRRTYNPAQSGYRASLLRRLGLLYRNSGQFAQAVEAFRQMGNMTTTPNPEAAVLVIDTYRQARDYDSALREAEAAVKKFPDERIVRIAYAEVLSDRGKIDEAVAEMNKLPKGEDDRENLIQTAQILEKGKRWQEMGRVLDQAERLSRNDDERIAVIFMRGAMLERMKKFDDAEAMFRKVIAMDADNAGALNYLGYMLADRNVRIDEAYNMIKKALEIDPQNGAYLDSMGWVYYRQGKYKEAEESLLRAIDRTGDDPTIHEHLGDVYAKLGNTKDAIAQWQAAMKAYQNSAESDQDPDQVAKLSKKLEDARVRLARESNRER